MRSAKRKSLSFVFFSPELKLNIHFLLVRVVSVCRLGGRQWPGTEHYLAPLPVQRQHRILPTSPSPSGRWASKHESSSRQQDLSEKFFDPIYDLVWPFPAFPGATEDGTERSFSEQAMGCLSLRFWDVERCKNFRPQEIEIVIFLLPIKVCLVLSAPCLPESSIGWWKFLHQLGKFALRYLILCSTNIRSFYVKV